MRNTVIQEWTDEKGCIHRIEIPLMTFLIEHNLEPVVRCKDCRYMTEHYDTDGNTVTNDGDAMSTETKERNHMQRLIDAEKLGLTDFEIVMCDGDYKEALKMLIEKIENAPTVDAEPKCAHVIVDEDGNMECSNCGSSFCFDNYCAHCGAKLIGERKYEVEYAD